ncbi:F-box protein [Quillaja saponaria]|uniref:F-box protein n=1 Tax=Quillaja saponaria TaxID=32244 RepID=A0AAD7QER6_QUISA|nr:F-box protein [Quillaja saponaria]
MLTVRLMGSHAPNSQMLLTSELGIRFSHYPPVLPLICTGDVVGRTKINKMKKTSTKSRKRGANTLLNNNEEGREGQCPVLCKFQQLPPITVMDILSRLPMKTIFHCRCVCKAWLGLISHPRFVELQLARSPISILIKTLPPASESRKINLTHVEACKGGPFRIDKMKFTPKINLPISKFGLVNSCNGLLCLSGSDREEPIYVCNPVLGEYITVPSATKDRHWGSFLGLGFCARTNQYKVLQTFYPNIESSWLNYLEAEIYTLGTGVWRSIGHAPRALVASPFNAFLHGALHWVPRAGNSSEFIYSFNFESEKFGSVPPPPYFGQSEKQFSDFLKLGVLEDCLLLCVFGNDHRKFDIWIMKDYGVKESWTKQFVIENLYPRQRSCDFYEPVKFLNNGEILLLYNDLEVLCYNTGTRRLRTTRITRTRNEFNAIALAPSFVSLYNVAKGEPVKRVQGSGENGKLSAVGIQDCAGSRIELNKSARLNSSAYETQPVAIIHFDPTMRTEFNSAAYGEYFDHFAVEGFSSLNTNRRVLRH